MTSPVPSSAPPSRPPAPFPGACAAGDEVRPVTEPAGLVREFATHGYLERTIAVERLVAGERRIHCLRVVWPPGARNSAGKPVSVAAHLDAAWFRAITNTLARVPFHHAQLVERIVIDDRPREHGIAPFDRRRADDGRDGRTIWLHEHLFRDPNHFAAGNYGQYYAYHTDRDGPPLDDQAPDHDRFIPILLHELGHLVLYALVHTNATGGNAAETPPCARTCRDDGTCAKLRPAERERGCISPYCGPFAFPGSSENWAEQYRFFYQSSTTRRLLSERQAGCVSQLVRLDVEAAKRAGASGSEPLQSPSPRAVAPWDRGLPDAETFHRSRWNSCGGRACAGNADAPP